MVSVFFPISCPSHSRVMGDLAQECELFFNVIIHFGDFFAFSFIEGALITGRHYDVVSFNALRQPRRHAYTIHGSCQALRVAYTLTQLYEWD